MHLQTQKYELFNSLWLNSSSILLWISPTKLRDGHVFLRFITSTGYYDTRNSINFCLPLSVLEETSLRFQLYYIAYRQHVDCVFWSIFISFTNGNARWYIRIQFTCSLFWRVQTNAKAAICIQSQIIPAVSMKIATWLGLPANFKWTCTNSALLL